MFIYENLKNRFFRQKFKKVCVLQRRACNKFKISNAIISKTTTIQNIHKNKKCSIFHDLFEYIIFSYDCNLLDLSFNYIITFFTKRYNKRKYLFVLGCS